MHWLAIIGSCVRTNARVLTRASAHAKERRSGCDAYAGAATPCIRRKWTACTTRRCEVHSRATHHEDGKTGAVHACLPRSTRAKPV